MERFFIALFFLSYSLLAMDPPKHNYDLKKIADLYNNIARSQLYTLQPEMKNKLVVGQHLGSVILATEIDRSFFAADSTNIFKFFDEDEHLINALRDNNFFQTIWSKEALKDQWIHVFSNLSADNFDAFRTGFFMRVKSNSNPIANIPEMYQFLFQENDDVKSLLDKLKKRQDKIKEKLEELSKSMLAIPLFAAKMQIEKYLAMLNGESQLKQSKALIVNKIKKLRTTEKDLANKNLKETLEIFLSHDAIPEIYKLNVNLDSFNEKDLPDVAQTIYQQLNEAIPILEERSSSLGHIVAAPLDITFLYIFFLFESLKKELELGKEFAKAKNAYLKRAPFDLLNSFNDVDELSSTNLLAPYAHQVMNTIGLMHGKDNALELHRPQEIHENLDNPFLLCGKNLDGTSENDWNDLCQNMITSEAADVDACEKTSSLPACSSHQEKNKTRFRNVKCVNSLSDPNDKNNTSLPLTKGFRTLDRLSRQLADKLVLNNRGAGSVSLALVDDKILVSTKQNRANIQIYSLFRNIVEESKHYALSLARDHRFDVTNIVAFKKIIRHQKNAIQKDEARRESVKEIATKIGINRNILTKRAYIDKIRLYLSLIDTETEDPELKKIQSILGSLQQSDFIIINNPFNYCSEQNAITYIRKKKAYLGYVDHPNKSSVPYQYIGGSMLNCGGCTCAIKGNKQEKIWGINHLRLTQDFLVFTRGNYNIYYGCPFPPWAFDINGYCKPSELYKKVKAACVQVSSVPVIEQMKKQHVLLSDSDEELSID